MRQLSNFITKSALEDVQVADVMPMSHHSQWLIATLGRETCIILPADVEDEHSLLAINVPFLRYTTDQSIRLTAFKVWFWLTRDCQFAISIESHACM